MNAKLPDDMDFPKSYLRPNDRWVCGYACGGQPCELGPNTRGICQIPGECKPARVGSHWDCGRLPTDGGPCEDGPSPTGKCGHTRPPCVPTPSWRTARGRWVRFCLAILACALAVLLSPSHRRNFLAPGALTQHHAQLLSQDNVRRCEACHGDKPENFTGWILPVHDSTTHAISQSDRCITCHLDVTSMTSGKLVHGLAQEVLSTMSQQAAEKVGKGFVMRPSPTNVHGEIACAACHREHHGAQFNLMAMSNDQCQVCHQEQFTSFQDGHPEFKRWPYERRTPIAFDHVTHAYRHFKEKGELFNCKQCHAVDSMGEIRSSPNFDACAECHAGPIQLSASQGIEILRLPSLDLELLREKGLALEAWPETLASDFDGVLPPFMWQLLSDLADPNVTQGMQVLGADFDFLDVDPENEEQLQAVVQVVSGVQMLLEKLADGGPVPLEVSTALLDAWTKPAVTGAEPPVEKVATLPSTGWIRDDSFHVLRYVPTGHGDIQMQALLNYTATATKDGLASLPASIAGASAAGLCRSCHSVEQLSAEANSLAFQWKGKGQSTSPHFTRFNHRPHLPLASLSDCTSCHELDPDTTSESRYVSANPFDHTPQFTPVKRESCVSCHTPEGAGSDCTQCHQYHASPRSDGSEPKFPASAGL